MKKIFIICAMMFAFVACGNANKNVEAAPAEVQEVVENVETTVDSVATETTTEVKAEQF